MPRPRPSNPTRHACARGRAAFLCALLGLALAASPARAASADACASRAPRATSARPQQDRGGALEDLGVWVKVARYGSAWQPCGVAPGWRPYFHGSWSWTQRGWFWVSDEPWGSATYHYGRWLFDSAHGWVWLPGKTWAPAWVRWRWNDEVIGWAPLEPGGTPYSAFWTFVPAARFVGGQVDAIAIPGPRIPALLLKTKNPSGRSQPAAAHDACLRRAGSSLRCSK